MSGLSYRGRPWWPEHALLVAPTPVALELRCPLPRILPPDNESVKTIRALEAITLNHVPLKETL